MSVIHGLLSVGQSPRFCWGWAKDTRWIIPCLDSGRLFLLKSSFFRMLEWEPVVKTVLLSSKFWKPAPAHWYREWNKVWGEVDQKVGASIRRWREHLVESRFCHQRHHCQCHPCPCPCSYHQMVVILSIHFKRWRRRRRGMVVMRWARRRNVGESWSQWGWKIIQKSGLIFF